MRYYLTQATTRSTIQQLAGQNRTRNCTSNIKMTQEKATTNSTIALKATIHGHVQGVFFRAFVRDAAQRLNLTGCVRNNPDGTVYVEAYGERTDLEDLLQLLWRGPNSARVSTVRHEWLAESIDTKPAKFEVTR